MKKELRVSPLVLLSWGFVILAFAAVGSVIYYQQTGLKLHFFHESVYPLLYAESNIQNQNFFSSTFSGREISPISWSPVGSLLLLISGGKTSMSVHVMYAVSFALAFLAVCVAYARQQKFSLFSSAAFLTLIFTVVSSVPSRYGQLDQVWLWPMNSYGVQDCFALLCVLLITPSLKEAFNPSIGGAKLRKALPAISFLVFVVFAFNGVRGALMIGAGLIFGLLIEAYFANGRGVMARRKLIGQVCTLSAATVLGLGIYSVFSRDVPQPFQTPHTLATLSSPEELTDRLGQYLWAWLNLFDGVPAVGSTLISAENSLVLLKAVLAISVLAVFLKKLKRANSLPSPVERVLTYRVLFILLVTLSASLFGDAAGLERYLLPLYFGFVFLVPFWLDALLEKRKLVELATVSILISALALGSIAELTKFGPDDYKRTELYGLSSHLKGQTLNYGFVSPWYSDGMILNQYSEGDVRVQPIDIDNSKLSQHIHSNSLLFDASAYPEDSTLFLAMPINEANRLANLESLAGRYLSKQTWNSWLILTYPRDQLISAIKKID